MMTTCEHSYFGFGIVAFPIKHHMWYLKVCLHESHQAMALENIDFSLVEPLFGVT